MSDPSDLFAAVTALHRDRWGECDTRLAEAIVRKLAEETVELAMAIQACDPDNLQAETRWELGDVLFVAVAACRIVDADPAKVLAAAIERNRERWQVS